MYIYREKEKEREREREREMYVCINRYISFKVTCDQSCGSGRRRRS